MHLWWMISLIGLLATVPEADANAFELMTNAYSVFVSGGRLLHDVSGGLGLISKVIHSFDNFLDYSAEEQISEAIEDSADTKVTSSTSSAKEKEEKPETRKPSSSGTVPPLSESPSQTDGGGCGVLGLRITDDTLPKAALTECCGVHDACYSSSCKAKKRGCDKDLEKCLKRACADLTLERQVQKTCQGAAKLLYSGTMALSSQQYSDAQGKLSCRKEENRRGRR